MKPRFVTSFVTSYKRYKEEECSPIWNLKALLLCPSICQFVACTVKNFNKDNDSYRLMRCRDFPVPRPQTRVDTNDKIVCKLTLQYRMRVHGRAIWQQGELTIFSKSILTTLFQRQPRFALMFIKLSFLLFKAINQFVNTFWYVRSDMYLLLQYFRYFHANIYVLPQRTGFILKNLFIIYQLKIKSNAINCLQKFFLYTDFN